MVEVLLGIGVRRGRDFSGLEGKGLSVSRWAVLSWCGAVGVGEGWKSCCWEVDGAGVFSDGI